MTEYFSVKLAYGARHASTASNIARTADEAATMAIRMVVAHGGCNGVRLSNDQANVLAEPWGRDERVRFVRDSGRVCGQGTDFYVSIVRSGGQR